MFPSIQTKFRYVTASMSLFYIALGIYGVSTVATGFAMLGRLAAYEVVRTSPLMLAGLCVAGVCVVVSPFALNWILRWSVIVSPLVLAGIVFILVVIAPSYKIASSSDQGDCIIVAARRLTSGLWPYDTASIWSHNPLSCGPGWVALHVPFLAIVSYPIAVLAIIVSSLIVMVLIGGWRRTSRFLVLLALIPSFWLSLADRVDFPTFSVVLAALSGLVESPWFGNWIVCFLTTSLAVAVSHFRLPYLVLPSS